MYVAKPAEVCPKVNKSAQAGNPYADFLDFNFRQASSKMVNPSVVQVVASKPPTAPQSPMLTSKVSHSLPTAKAPAVVSKKSNNTSSKNLTQSSFIRQEISSGVSYYKPVSKVQVKTNQVPVSSVSVPPQAKAQGNATNSTAIKKPVSSIDKNMASLNKGIADMKSTLKSQLSTFSAKKVNATKNATFNTTLKMINPTKI